MEFQISVPLDGEGFLRRECPTCEREFKWLPSPNEVQRSADATESIGSPEAYYCPYCGIRAPTGSWWTKAQVAASHALVDRSVVQPGLDDLERELKKLNRTSGGLLQMRVDMKRVRPEPAPDLIEANDMRRIDFVCHPSEPVKIAEDWAADVYCLICGGRRSAT